MGVLSSDLLAQAKLLATHETRRPKQASLRRSISTAYYALFHFLVEEATFEFVGSGGINTQMGRFAARAIAHKRLKDVCIQFRKPRADQMSEIIKPLANQLTFVGDLDLVKVTQTFYRSTRKAT